MMNATGDAENDRREESNALRVFASREEVSATLAAAVAAAIAKGYDKIAYWQEVGDYVLAAAQRAQAIIQSIDPELSAVDYASRCRAALAQEAERFVNDPSDAASFYGTTLYGIIRWIEE